MGTGIGGGQVPLVKLTELLVGRRRRGRSNFESLVESALSRQVLRQAGVVYQFRHAALQDHLAAKYTELSSREDKASCLTVPSAVTTSVVSPYAARADLTAGMAEAGVRDVEAVLEAFADEQFLTLGRDTAEISHEVLLSAWKQLRDLPEGDQLDRVLYVQLVADARGWDANRRDPSYLYRAGRLAQVSTAASRWASDPERHPPLPPAGTAFLDAARRAARRARLRRQAVIAALLVLTLASVTAAGLAQRSAATANQQRAIVLSQQLAAESISLDPTSPVTARQLALAAWRMYHTDQAASAMTTLLNEQQENGDLPATPSAAGVAAVAFSPNGKFLASADGDGYVRLWDTATDKPAGQPLPVAPQPPGTRVGLGALAFSPDGKLLASAAGGSMRLWDTATDKPAGQPLPATPGSGVYGVAFSPDGKLLASGDSDGYVQLWDTATGKQIGTPLPSGPSSDLGVFGVAFSPDGKLLASTDGLGFVRIWDTATGKPAGKPLPAGNEPIGLAFSPDGRLLAVASFDGYVRLLDTATGKPDGRPLPADPAAGVYGVAFSPDGKLLASADGDGYVQLWGTATGKHIGQPLPADPQPTDQTVGVSGVAFSPDGGLLASANLDGYVQLWDTATGKPAHAPLPAGSGAGVNTVAFSSDGKLLASASDNGVVRLWDTATGGPAGKAPACRFELGPHRGGVQS